MVEEVGSSFEFELVEAAKFKSLESKAFQELFLKWGIQETLKLRKFRFNQGFDSLSAQEFLKDFFCNVNVRNELNSVCGSLPQYISKVDFTPLECNILGMDFFDSLLTGHMGVAMHDGDIMKVPEDYIQGIQVGDRLRESLINEESEFYEIFNEEQRSQFIFQLFQLLCLGGSMCQYEDNVNVYLNTTKAIYKDIISVGKDQDSGQINILSRVYKINAIEENIVHGEEHIQNVLFLIIDPFHRIVNVLVNKWNPW